MTTLSLCRPSVLTTLCGDAEVPTARCLMACLSPVSHLQVALRQGRGGLISSRVASCDLAGPAPCKEVRFLCLLLQQCCRFGHPGTLKCHTGCWRRPYPLGDGSNRECFSSQSRPKGRRCSSLTQAPYNAALTPRPGSVRRFRSDHQRACQVCGVCEELQPAYADAGGRWLHCS